MDTAEEQLELVRKGLYDFEAYMKPEYVAWDGDDQRQTWRVSLTLVESLAEIGELALQFISKISNQVKSSDPQAITGKLVSEITAYDVAAGLLALELAISWEGVLDTFRNDRDNWSRPLREFRDRENQIREERKLAELGDLTSVEVGLRVVKEGLLQFEGFMRRECMSWIMDQEREDWRQEVLAARTGSDLGRLVIRFVSKITPGSISSWENGYHSQYSRILTASDVCLGKVAEILLTIECQVPWSGVIDAFIQARTDWRHSLEALQRSLALEEASRENVLTTVKTSLTQLEGYIVRSALQWESPEQRSIWITSVLQAETLPEVGKLMYEFISKIRPESFFSAWVESGKQNLFHAKLLHPGVKIQTLIQVLVNIECSVSWSAVVPLFRTERNNWLNNLVNLPQFSWPEDEENLLELALLDAAELRSAPVLNRSANIRASLRSSSAAKRTGRVSYDRAPKNTMELITTGVSKSYGLHTTLEENDKMFANLHIQSLPSEDLEFYLNFVTDSGENVLRVKFEQRAHSKGVVECYSFTHQGQSLIPGATSDSWNNTFPFTVGQDFEFAILAVDDSTLSLVFDGVFVINDVSTYPRSIEDIHRITLVGKSGRVLCKNISFKFSRTIELIPE